MTKKHFDYHTIVIGAGAGGLVVALGLAKAGKSVLMIEERLIGGDCTHFGCLPSKSLIASANAAHVLRSAETLALNYNITDLNCTGALSRVRSIVADVAATETPQVVGELGIHSLRARGSLVDPHTVSCMLPDGGVRSVTGRHIVLATGSSPIPLNVPGASDAGLRTNHTIFDLEQIPPRLAVIGTGPIGVELGSAFNRLGSEVTIIGRSGRILPREELEAAELTEELMSREGVHFELSSKIERIEREGEIVRIHREGQDPIEAEEVLVAIGRTPNVKEVGLEKIDVYFNDRGVQTDRYGRTTQKHIFAVGDVTGCGYFTHVAEHQARAVLKSLLVPFLLFSLDKKQPIPRVTFTDPEVASIGLSEEAARKKWGRGSIASYTLPFTKVKRAIAAGDTEGFVKIVTKKWSSKIVGATIVGGRAGEMLMEISTAMNHRIPLRKLAKVIHPFPTYGRAIRHAADLYFQQTIFPFFRKQK